MLAGLEGGDRLLGVHKVRRRDEHRVEVLRVGEEVLVVLEGLRRVVELLQQALGPREVVRPDIAHRGEADARNGHRGVGEDAAFLAAADDGHVERVSAFGAHLGGPGDVGGGRGHRTELGAGAEEAAAGEGDQVGHGIRYWRSVTLLGRKRKPVVPH